MRSGGADGQSVFARNVGELHAGAVAAKVLQACQQGPVTTVANTAVPIAFESICILSDTRGAYEGMCRTRAGRDAAGCLAAI